MNYQETIEYLFARLPMYQRIGGAAYKADLKNTIEMSLLLGNPERHFRSVHIAGTNGKGSTAHMLASVMKEAGYKTGLYTSPHYHDFRERIKINGHLITEEYVVDFVAKNKNDLEKIDLSFFEMTVGMAFAYFADNKVDIAIVETGMGGRLDSTNIITPIVSVITNIGNDHKQFLGNTLPEIAREKAGIIKPGIPVVIGETHHETKPVFKQSALTNASEISFADQVWQVTSSASNSSVSHNRRIFKNGRHMFDLPYKLQGTYQNKNLATVLQTIDVLMQNGLTISHLNILNGLYRVVENTGLMGRWQIIGHNPLIVCDSGHNPEGISLAMENIREASFSKLHVIFGMVNDKQPEALLTLLPRDAHFYFCKANIPRGMPAEKLKKHAEEIGLTGNAYPSVLDALNAAKVAADSTDMIFVGGSIFVVAEAL